MIKKTFSDGLSCIRCFERWNKHQELLIYSEALETWDKEVGDDWGDNAQETTSLDPVEWIQEHPIWFTRDKDVEDLVSSAYSKSMRFLTRFQPLLEIYWRNKQFDINILVNEKLINAVESLSNTLALHKYYTVHF